MTETLPEIALGEKEPDEREPPGDPVGGWPAETGTPRLAVGVSVFHFIALAGAVAGAIAGHKMTAHYDPVLSVGLLAVSFGVVGGTLLASRTVVFTVRHGAYDSRFFLWQVWTPIYGGLLGGVTALLMGGGILVASSGPLNVTEGRQQLFLASTAFLAGFASEVLVKRLIAAAEALFGESTEATLDRTGRVPPNKNDGRQG